MASFYSNCSTLALNCVLYADSGLVNTVPAGFYSDGVSCFEANGLGVVTAVSPCAVACDIEITGITSTDPTTVGGTDGTITAIFSTTHGPSTYTLNGGSSLPASSPLVISGLSSSVPYTVIITDGNACSVQSTVTLGQSATLFDADWIMVTYQFTDGSDLDTRTRIALPDVGMDLQSEYLGWSCKGSFDNINADLSYTLGGGADPNAYILLFGNDNTGLGFESVLVNVTRFKQQFPAATDFTIDLRGFWYSSQGFNPVIAATTLWKGGTPIHDGCEVGITPFCWTNPTAQFTQTIDSVPKVVTLFPPTNKGISPGQRIATLKYNLTTLIAVLNNADVTTPEVL